VRTRILVAYKGPLCPGKYLAALKALAQYHIRYSPIPTRTLRAGGSVGFLLAIFPGVKGLTGFGGEEKVVCAFRENS
jgi:hypothetical protein